MLGQQSVSSREQQQSWTYHAVSEHNRNLRRVADELKLSVAESAKNQWTLRCLFRRPPLMESPGSLNPRLLVKDNLMNLIKDSSEWIGRLHPTDMKADDFSKAVLHLDKKLEKLEKLGFFAHRYQVLDSVELLKYVYEQFNSFKQKLAEASPYSAQNGERLKLSTQIGLFGIWLQKMVKQLPRSPELD